jgi:uncharacterized coiled-coil DUF342 family protein
MPDIVERLRTLEGWNTTGPKALMFEAADEIKKLRTENAAIRELMNNYNLGGWTDSLTLIKERDKLQIKSDDLKSDMIAMQRERDELRENGDRLRAVADSAVAHQQDMIEAVAGPLRDTIDKLRKELDAALIDAANYRSLMGKT